MTSFLAGLFFPFLPPRPAKKWNRGMCLLGLASFYGVLTVVVMWAVGH